MPAELVINEALSFDDVILLPQYSDIKSRKDVDLTMKLWSQDGKTQYSFSLPVISSPMDTVTGPEMAYFMWKNGGLGILHRYCSIEEQVEMVNQAYKKFNEEVVFSNRNLIIGAAIGANGDYLERANALISAGVQIICIDVAHGDSKHMRTALAYLQKIVPGYIHIMAGNVATPDGFERLASWGANSVRAGVSSGAACSTAIATGHGLPTLATIDLLHRSKLDKCFDKCAIIADGGIRSPGDLVKSFAFGADFCILGSMLAGAKCAPGEIINQNGKWMKNYRGSASYAAQKARGQDKPRVEGVSALVPYKGKIENILDSIKDGLQSGCSYSGVNKLSELNQIALYAKITNAGYNQSIPHILNNI